MNTNENLELFGASAFCLILLVVLPYIGAQMDLIGLGEWWVVSLVMFTPPTIALGVLSAGDAVRARSIRS